MKTPLQHWIRDLAIKDEMIWKSAAEYQVVMFRDKIAPLVGVGAGSDYEESPPGAFVIATHRSKSIDLPVVLMERPDLGIKFVMRDNFHDVKLSVISERPIESDAFKYLFMTEPPPDIEYTGDELSSVYFEGFPIGMVFGYYSQSQNRFSASIGSHQSLWTVLFTCMRCVGGLTPMKYHTRESRRRELDEHLAKSKARSDARKAAK